MLRAGGGLNRIFDEFNYNDILLVPGLVGESQLPVNPCISLHYGLVDESREPLALSQLAALGDSVDELRRYSLVITAQSLLDDWRLENIDLTLNFDPRLFRDVNASDIYFGKSMPLVNAVRVDNNVGSIRFAVGSAPELIPGSGLFSEEVLAVINLDLDEAYLRTFSKDVNGVLSGSPLAFSIQANLDETVLSRYFDDLSGYSNREIATVSDLDGGITVAGIPVALYESRVDLQQQRDGMVLGTERVIGIDAGFTNLIRSGDTIKGHSEWLNVGNVKASELSVQSLANPNARLGLWSLSKASINSGSFVNGSFDQNGRESVTVSADIHIIGDAGSVVHLSDGIFSLVAQGSDVFSNAGKGSSNLVTFKGDLNYDGRVSMKDLAYLNAGAARQRLDASTGLATADSYARDVDADYDGKIDLADLAVLDQDWGKSLHTGQDAFVGSSEISWDALDAQGASSTWNNDSFKDQNAVEAAAGYVGSLESPTAAGAIGADGNTTANDGGIQGTYFQDSLAA